ncbi:type II secretion system minor pseudopilin GspJ [Halorhodospira abdelmalekii]|uniref:type II secretion system minor pseudopilin GspJ n=1 Tax=Halorhodospira abdelmalekii TaxID=421629 RepID=UPI0019043A90|nr:type II secretion system minor pseudopilin GspJ [Halorhodospira abdelmalekii]
MSESADTPLQCSEGAAGAKKRAAAAGFTLLEVVVAVAIFALVAVMAYGGLQTVLETRSRVVAEGQRLSELQLAFGVMARDFRQHVARDWSDAWRDRRPSLGFDPLDPQPRLELISAGGRVGMQRSELQRISYELDDGVLYRLVWHVIDGGGEEPHIRSRLAGESGGGRATIDDLYYTFYYRPVGGGSPGERRDDIERLAHWPPDRAQGLPPGELLAVAVTLELAGGAQVYRLFPVQGAGSGSGAANGSL